MGKLCCSWDAFLGICQLSLKFITSRFWVKVILSKRNRNILFLRVKPWPLYFCIVDLLNDHFPSKRLLNDEIIRNLECMKAVSWKTNLIINVDISINGNSIN